MRTSRPESSLPQCGSSGTLTLVWIVVWRNCVDDSSCILGVKCCRTSPNHDMVQTCVTKLGYLPVYLDLRCNWMALLGSLQYWGIGLKENCESAFLSPLAKKENVVEFQVWLSYVQHVTLEPLTLAMQTFLLFPCKPWRSHHNMALGLYLPWRRAAAGMWGGLIYVGVVFLVQITSTVGKTVSILLVRTQPGKTIRYLP